MNHELSYVKNLAISASAGTGKTYRLAMRYIAILLNGAEPEEITAITFSRKAAAEIYDRILRRLLELIVCKTELEKAVEDGYLPPWITVEDNLVPVLRKLLSSRKKLHIETNDSFLMQIVQTAPSEFGIHGEISMIDEEDDRPRQKAFLRTLHSPRFSDVSAEGAERRKAELYYVLRDSSFGAQKSSLYGSVTKMLKEYYRAWLAFPREEQWTLSRGTLIPENLLSAEELAALRTQFEQLKNDPENEGVSADKRIEDRFTALFEEAERILCSDTPPRPDSKKALFFIGDREFNILTDTPPFSGTYYRKTFVIGSRLAGIVKRLVLHLLTAEYLALLNRAQAVFQLMSRFHDSYDELTREAGKLTFSDILYLINRNERENFGAMQVLRERLAMTVNHYLMDEFQDTSDEQWNAFRDLADEVIQYQDDSSRNTSFFMVGDTKQSIYQWREGNPELFKRISGFYRMEKESLSDSFRSAKPVLDFVNRVFETSLSVNNFPERLHASAEMYIEQREKMEFEGHASSIGAERRPETGCAMVFETAPVEKEDPVSQEEHLWKAVCGLIRTLNPFSAEHTGKPLSVGVLFRKNDNILSCYEAMKQYAPELNVSMEGELRLADSMSYQVFRQLLLLSAHPGDSTAEGFLGMLGNCDGSVIRIAERLYPGMKGSLASLIRQEIHQTGYEGFFRHFRKEFPETDKETEYMDLARNALAESDSEKNISTDELLIRLDRCRGKLSSSARTVQLMTVHKSKGLEFDILILPDMASKDGQEKQFIRGKNRVFFKPAAAFLPYFPEAENVVEQQERDNCYEKCCNLYVALTRAARGLYLFIPPENSESNAEKILHADMIRAVISGQEFRKNDPAVLFAEKVTECAEDPLSPVKPLYCTGNPEWTSFMPRAETAKRNPCASAEQAFLCRLVQNTQKMEKYCTATGSTPENKAEAPSYHRGSPAYRFASSDAAKRGTAIHTVLSQLKWPGTDEENLAFLRRTCPDEESLSILEKALTAQEIINALRPGNTGYARLLIEQPFLMKEENGFVRGIMDRAVLYYNENGIPLCGEVIDYKTDEADDPEIFREKYTRQLQLYRRVLSDMTGLAEEKISCRILALRLCRCIEIV